MTSIRPALDRGFREELRADRRTSRSEFKTEAQAERVARRERRKADRGDSAGGGIQPTTPVTTTPASGTQGSDTVSIQPVPNPTTPPVSTKPIDDTVKGLAEKYVDTYTKQSGRTLSATTRDALVNDVASFYSENGDRTDRLRSLVGVL